MPDDFRHIEPTPFAWMTPMKFIIIFITAVALIGLLTFLSGCGCLVIYDTKSGNVAAVKLDFLQDVTVGRYATTEKGTTIERGSSVVNDAAVEKIVEGVVTGIIKGAK